MMACCAIFGAFIIGILGLVFAKLKKYFEVPSIPKLEETWWGKGEPGQEDAGIEPFKINISDESLRDLKQRIENALDFEEPIENAGQTYGMNTALLKTIVDYWKTEYKWRERETFLNQYPQFRVSVQGLKIHYLHVKPANPEGLKVFPLLLVHGWPGSVREFYEIIPLLTTAQAKRDFVFEVIAPSLPGYWFSDATRKKGLGPAEMAVIFKNLMKKLGFKKYYIQGGDWGSAIVCDLAILFPEYISGVLTNLPMALTNLQTTFKMSLSEYLPFLVLTEEEQRHAKYFSVKRISTFRGEESGYFSLQSTKPDTVGVGLRDSPVGLAAYIFEKFITWTNPDYLKVVNGQVENKANLTTVLDIITTYWLTRTITTSVRIYYEYMKTDSKLRFDRIPISEVPSGVARYAHDLYCIPENVLKGKFTKMVYSSFHEAGHFAALEVPNTLAEDIFKFVENVQNRKSLQ